MSQTTEDDTVELPEPLRKKSRKYQSRSPAWDHFARETNEEGITTKATCNYCGIQYPYGGYVGKKLEKCLREWEIDNVFTISVDNAATKVKAIDFLKERFETLDNCLLKGGWTHMRCVAHILNLVVQDGIKKVGKPVENVRYAVKWIRLSPSRIAKFHKFAEDVNCDSKKHLVRDVPTRYNLEEIGFGKDVNEAGFSVPSKEDWVKVRDLCNFLKHFYDVTLRVSGTSYPTSNSCNEDIGEIRILLNDSLVDPKNQFYDIALAMKMKFDKYFGEIKGMNLLLNFSLLLDPRNKKKYFNIVLEDHYGRRGKQILSEKKGYILENLEYLYADYVRIHSLSSKTESSSSSTILGKRSNLNDMVSKPPLPVRNKLREMMEIITMEPMNELDKYFSEVEEINSDNFDILAWWKVNSPRFPTLSTMARDLLAIPVSTVASESVFSTSGRILDAFRSSLTPKTAKSIICTQDWIRSSTSANPNIEEDFDTIQHMPKELGASWST